MYLNIHEYLPLRNLSKLWGANVVFGLVLYSWIQLGRSNPIFLHIDGLLCLSPKIEYVFSSES